MFNFLNKIRLNKWVKPVFSCQIQLERIYAWAKNKQKEDMGIINNNEKEERGVTGGGGR